MSDSDIWPPLPSTGDYSEDVYQMMKEAYDCTEEDANVKFTTEQLKELCLKHKCHVVASRWNIAYEYQLWLRNEGRFEGKSARYIRHMIAKGVNRHKHKISYNEKEIEQTLKNEWRLRKKDSILSLKLWAREREQQEKQLAAEGNASESDSYLESFLNDSEGELSVSPASTVAFPCNTEDINANAEYGFETYFVVKSENEDKTLLGSHHIEENLCKMFDINTESMTVSEIDTESLSQIPSQDIFSEDFNSAISCTSTQRNEV